MEKKGLACQTSILEQVDLRAVSRSLGALAGFIHTAVGGAGIRGENGEGIQVGCLFVVEDSARGSGLTPGKGTGGRIAVNPSIEKTLKSRVIFVIKLQLGIIYESVAFGGL